jgi:cell division protease FtsH
METSMKLKEKIAIASAMVICLVSVLWMTTGSRRGQITLTYSQFLEQARAGQVASVIITGGDRGATQATCRLKNGNTVRTVLPSDYRDAMTAMQDEHVNIEIQDSSSGPLRLFSNAAPFILLLGYWIFLVRRFPNGPRQGILS